MALAWALTHKRHSAIYIVRCMWHCVCVHFLLRSSHSHAFVVFGHAAITPCTLYSHWPAATVGVLMTSPQETLFETPLESACRGPRVIQSTGYSVPGVEARAAQGMRFSPSRPQGTLVYTPPGSDIVE